MSLILEAQGRIVMSEKVEQVVENEEVTKALESIEEELSSDMEQNPLVAEQKEYYSTLVRHYKGDHKKALFEFCFKNNIFFDF